MKKMIFAFSHFDTGGLQTLIIRICQWCQLNDVIPYLIYETCDEYMEKLCIENKIIHLKSFKYKNIKDFIIKNINKNDNVTLITFELNEFIFFEKIHKTFMHKHYKIKHFIYNVSVGGMIYGREISGVKGKIIYNIYKKIVTDIFNNNQVFFMDLETMDSALNYYNILCNKKEQHIYLLPMFISEYNDKILFDYKEKNFLTVSRAIFPYKGYLIGLIKDFKSIIEGNSNVSLTIVTFGENYNDIKKIYNLMPQNVKKNINIINGLPLEKIRELLKKTFFYIGMGTTVLDAADESVPSIVVWHSTMENICSGFFIDNPKVVGKFGKGINGEELIKKTLNLKEDEYMEIKKNTYESYRDNYDINRIIPKILDRDIFVNKIFINKIQFLAHDILFKIRNIRKKILKKSIYKRRKNDS